MDISFSGVEVIFTDKCVSDSNCPIKTKSNTEKKNGNFNIFTTFM